MEWEFMIMITAQSISVDAHDRAGRNLLFWDIDTQIPKTPLIYSYLLLEPCAPSRQNRRNPGSSGPLAALMVA